jgi:hypothetical protein
MFMGHLKETGFAEQCTAFLGDHCNMMGELLTSPYIMFI